MKKMKFLFAILAIVFAAGSAFTPAKKAKLDPEKRWFKLVNTAYPENTSSYELTTPLVGDEGDDIGCPYEHSNAVCAIYATSELVGSTYRPSADDLADIVTASDHFQYKIEENMVLQFEEEE